MNNIILTPKRNEIANIFFYIKLNDEEDWVIEKPFMGIDSASNPTKLFVIRPKNNIPYLVLPMLSIDAIYDTFNVYINYWGDYCHLDKEGLEREFDELMELEKE